MSLPISKHHTETDNLLQILLEDTKRPVPKWTETKQIQRQFLSVKLERGR